MTTIAYRDGVLAADQAATRGTVIISGVIKAARASNGDLIAAAGDAGYNGAFLRWAEAGCAGDPPKANKEDNGWDTGLIFKADGTLILHEPSGWFTMRPAYYAIGSGKDIALGVMFAGGSAEQAVLAAIEHDFYTRGPITVLTHGH